MIPIKKILVPTDFSDCASLALRYAIGLARPLGASIDLLHVYQIPTYPIPDGGAAFMRPDAIALFLSKIEDALARTKASVAEGGAVPIVVGSVEGLPFVEIPRAAEQRGCQLIVMGTHGHTGLKHLLLGSVAERVVRASSVPVITYRSPEHAKAVVL